MDHINQKGKSIAFKEEALSELVEVREFRKKIWRSKKKVISEELGEHFPTVAKNEETAIMEVDLHESKVPTNAD